MTIKLLLTKDKRVQYVYDSDTDIRYGTVYTEPAKYQASDLFRVRHREFSTRKEAAAWLESLGNRSEQAKYVEELFGDRGAADRYTARFK